MRRDGGVLWFVVMILTVVSAGAYIGNESARYFWDLTSYVEALDSPFPYRDQQTFPFLYPPFTADLFTLARSHLFELLSILYVGAAAFFLWSYSHLNVKRKYEWLFAMTAIGGLGIVSIQSGNLALLLNLGLLGLLIRAGEDDRLAVNLVPAAIGLGALMKPQFIVYLPLTFLLEKNRRSALMKCLPVIVGVSLVYGSYVLLRPNDWYEYVQAVTKRAVVEKDFAWGPSGLIKHWSDDSFAAVLAYIGGLLTVGVLAWRTWRRSPEMPAHAMLSLAFVALTFINPRLPLYDVYAAAIAVGVCSAFAAVPSTVLAGVMFINLVPWLISEFARRPSAWPWWLQDLQITHVLGLGLLLVTLARNGVQVRHDE